MLDLYFLIYFYFCSFNYGFLLLFIFLVFSVCEGSLGLSVFGFYDS